MDARSPVSFKTGISVADLHVQAPRSRGVDNARFKILVPIDGSSASLHALDYVANSRDPERLEIFLLNVRPAIRVGDIFRFSSMWDAVEAERVAGEDVMRPAMLRLDARRIHYSAEVAFGPVAETIIGHAHKRGCDSVCVATKGNAGILRRLVESVACRVLRLADIPVAVINDCSPEREGEAGAAQRSQYGSGANRSRRKSMKALTFGDT